MLWRRRRKPQLCRHKELFLNQRQWCSQTSLSVILRGWIVPNWRLNGDDITVYFYYSASLRRFASTFFMQNGSGLNNEGKALSFIVWLQAWFAYGLARLTVKSSSSLDQYLSVYAIYLNLQTRGLVWALRLIPNRGAWTVFSCTVWLGRNCMNTNMSMI